MPEPDPRFEVPPEYAAVYEEAFRRASEGGPHGNGENGAGGTLDEDRAPWWARRPALLGLSLVLVIVVGLAAFLVGRSSRPGDLSASPVSPGPSTSPAASTTRPTASPTSAAVEAVRASTQCPEPRVSDGNGDSVSFAPANVLDDDTSTSWACVGDAVGQQLVLTLPARTRVSAVGLLPTAELGGVGLNRIRAVEWIFDDGSAERQVLTTGATPTVELQGVREHTTRTVRLRLLDVGVGPADLTAVSSVFLTGPTR